MKKLFIVVILVLLPAVAFANFSIKFENTNNTKMVYSLYWLDHPFNSLRPANLAAGELGAAESRSLSYQYNYGKYAVVWRDSNGITQELLIDIQKDVIQITVTPIAWHFEKVDLYEF